MYAVRLQPTFRLPASSRKIEEYVNKVGYSGEILTYSHRTRLSDQWFVKMSEIIKPAHAAMMDDDIRFIPDNSKTPITTGWKA